MITKGHPGTPRTGLGETFCPFVVKSFELLGFGDFAGTQATGANADALSLARHLGVHRA